LKELPKKWLVALRLAIFVVPFFMILRGIGTDNSDLIVLAIWTFLFGAVANIILSPSYSKDGNRVQNWSSFLEACRDKEAWKWGLRKYWMIDICALVTCNLLMRWGVPWQGILGFICIMLLAKVDQSRREFYELRSQP